MLPREAPEPAGRRLQEPLSRLRLTGARPLPGAVVLVRALGAGALSGAATALAFPPADLGPLAFVSLTPLVFVFMRATPRTTAAASTAFGLTFFGMFWQWIRLFGPEAYVGLTIFETAFVVAMLAAGQWVMHRLESRGARWTAAAPLAFPLAFLAGEYLRSHLPLGGFGWGGLGYSQHENLLLLRLASYTGVWGISLVLASTATLAERALTCMPAGRLRRGMGCVAGGVALAMAPALLPVSTPGGAHARIAAVQGSLPEPSPIPETSPVPDAGDRPALDSQLELTRSLVGKGPWSLVVWPESSVDVDPFRNQDVHDLLVDSVRAIRTPMLVGAKTDEPDGRFRNVSLLFGADGRLVDRYDKQHFVPFGEYVPFRKLLVPLVSELQQVPRDGVPGTRATVFTLPEGRFAAAICFESTFPGLVREFVDGGARLLVVSTNDSSFERSAAARQHLAAAQLRAAEHRMWVVQAALTGITSFVEPSGRVVSKTGLFQRTVAEGDVRFATTRTVYGRFGDWLPALCFLFLGAGALVATRSPRPSRPRRPFPSPDARSPGNAASPVVNPSSGGDATSWPSPSSSSAGATRLSRFRRPLRSLGTATHPGAPMSPDTPRRPRPADGHSADSHSAGGVTSSGRPAFPQMLAATSESPRSSGIRRP